jgi:geranylgeranyl pyrophosphate synthase
MVGGQAIDLEAPERAPVWTDSARCTREDRRADPRGGGGAVMARPARRSWRPSSFRLGLGLAFQIVDDILDVEGASEAPARRRQGCRGKPTYPALYGLERRAGWRRMRDRALAALDGRRRPRDRSGTSRTLVRSL